VSKLPDSYGKRPFVAPTRTHGSPLGRNDAADPDTPDWFLGDTPGSLGNKDYADPTLIDSAKADQPNLRGGMRLAYAGLNFELPVESAVLAAKKFDIRKIPGIMSANGWHIGAQLMYGWFGRPANDDPLKGITDTMTIKMDTWVLTFERAKSVYDQIFADKIYANPAAQREIAKMLKRKGLLDAIKKARILKDKAKKDKTLEDKDLADAVKSNFGDFSRPVPEIDADYINERAVGSIWDPLDDMYAALGKFNLRVAVKGFIKLSPDPSTLTYVVNISEVGVYLRDSYDFNGDQSLGYWNASTNYGGGNPFKGTPVANSDFRDWRTANKKGGDFLVFSDLKIVKISPPAVFNFS